MSQHTFATQSDGYLSLRSLSMYSGLSIRTLRNYLRHPACPLPFYRVGGRILIRISEFDRWVEQFRTRHAVAIDDLIDEVLHELR